MSAANIFSGIDWRHPRRWHLGFTATELTAFERGLLIAGWAGLTTLLAQIAFPLPGTPVPFTLQVVGVLGAGAFLRRGDATAALVLYVALGALGAPVYANGGGGSGYLLGPTGGYLLAFPLAAALVGHGFHRARTHGATLPRVQWRNWLAALAVIYLGGALGLIIALDASPTQAWAWGVRPFIALDLLKIVVLGAATTHLWRYR